MPASELELSDYRRRVSDLYGAVRADLDPRQGHAIWRSGRDELFGTHPSSPLPPGDRLRRTGLPYWDYDPAVRFELPLLAPGDARQLKLPTGDSFTTITSVGRVHLPEPFDADLEVWWLEQYAGGLFLPVRDGSAGDTSYGGGRYLLDTSKSADLGGSLDHLVIDLNFLYHPSCRYDSAWVCPLAPPSNTIKAPIHAGERL